MAHIPPTSIVDWCSLRWIARVVWRVHRGAPPCWPKLQERLGCAEVASQVLTSSQSKKPVRQAVFSSVRQSFIVGALLAAFRGVLEQGVLPILLYEVVHLITVGPQLVTGARLVIAVGACRLLEAICESVAFTLVVHLSTIRASATLSAMVLTKSLRVDGAIEEQVGGLSARELLGVELPKLVARMPEAGMGLVALGGFTSGIFVVFYLLGPAAGTAGLAWTFLLSFGSAKARHQQMLNEKPLVEVTTQRMAMLSTLLATIRGVKLFGWEFKYLERLEHLRCKECHRIRAFNSWWFLGNRFGTAVPTTTPLVAFLVFALLGNEPTAAEFFACNVIFAHFRINVDTLALLLGTVNSARLLVHRAQTFLDLPEQLPRNLLLAPSSSDANIESKTHALGILQDASVAYLDRADGSVQTSRSESLVQPVVQSDCFKLYIGDLCVKPGQLLAICGRVASGKSTLLGALSGALSNNAALESGTTSCVEDVALVPQHAFLLSGTLRENILMGRHCDELKLKSVLHDAALVEDLDAFPRGLEEEVGERGTTLSGGQQARVNFARALYGSPRLLFVDDVLAAVDTKVALVLFHALCRHASSGRSAVVTLNQTALLPNFDSVLFLGGGKVIGQGTYSQLHTSCQPFVNFVSNLGCEANGSSLRNACNENQDIVATGAVRIKECEAKNRLVIKAEDELVRREASLRIWVVDYSRLAGRSTTVLCVACQAAAWSLQAARDWWLGVWSAAADSETRKGYYIVIYASLCLSQLAFHCVCAALTVIGCLHASREIHSSCIKRLLNAPLGYFEETPVGRILSRLGTDLSQLDTLLSVYLEEGVGFFLFLIVLILGVAAQLPIMIPFLLFACVCFWIPCKAGFRARVAARRLANSAMGPLFSNLTEVQSGRNNVIRVMNLAGFFIDRHYAHHDEQTRFNHIGMATMNFGRFSVDLANSIVTAAAVATCLLGSFSPEVAGFVVSYSVLVGKMSMVLNIVFSQLFTCGANLERMLDLEQGELPQEDCAGDCVHDGWPMRGEVEFVNVTLRYRESAPLVLQNLNACVCAGERCGIMGRTGAGKSSLVTCLFRLVSASLVGGQVRIDGLDITTINIRVLRQKLAMIPQEPVLMAGTTRQNLDPFSERTDLELIQALEMAHLGYLELGRIIVRGGAALSAGEQQLLCFARILLSKRRVIVADEPTASIDPDTDGKIQQLLREAFQGSTLLCVAHRVETVMDYDHILVMRDGQVIEDGSPQILLQNPNSQFAQYKHVTESGKSTAEAGLLGLGGANTVTSI